MATDKKEISISKTFKSLERVTKDEAEDAVRVLLRWAGEDPNREGLIDTPSRYVKAFREWFAGYENDPVEILSRTFEEVEGYDEMVVLRNVRFESHCEHHIAPIIGNAHVAYLPDGRIIGLSKIPRIVDVFARRLQVQERLTVQVAEALQQALQPKGVGVIVEARRFAQMFEEPVATEIVLDGGEG